MASAQESSRAELLWRSAEKVPPPAEVYQRLAGQCMLGVRRLLRPVCGTRISGQPAPAGPTAGPGHATRVHRFRTREHRRLTWEAVSILNQHQSLGRRRGGNERAADHAPGRASPAAGPQPPRAYPGLRCWRQRLWLFTTLGIFRLVTPPASHSLVSFYHHPVTMELACFLEIRKQNHALSKLSWMAMR